MPQNSPSAPAAPAVQLHLRTVAQLLHQTRHLDPQVQELLADFVDELGTALNSTEVPPAELAHLAESAAQAVQAMHDREEHVLSSARDRLRKTIIGTEMKFPALADIARRLADALAGLGI